MFCLKRGQGLLAVAAGFSAGATQARAADATAVLVQSVGPVHIKPHLSLAARYDDNIFYRSGKPTLGLALRPVADDFITVVSPGVSLQLGRKEANHLLLDYQYDQSFYLRHDDQNSGDHSFSLGSSLVWKRTALTGTDRVQFLSGILGGSANLGQKVDRITYYDHYALEYAFSDKTAIYAEGLFDAVDYASGTALYDSNTLRGTAGFALRATSKTSFFGEGYYGQAAVDPNVTAGRLSDQGPHQDFFGGFVGVKGEFTPRLSGQVKAGYEARTFSDNTPAPSSPVVEASLEHRLSEKTLGLLTYSRRNSVSVQGAGQSYTADAVGVQLNQVLGSNGKLSGTVGGSFENDDYERIGGAPVRHDVWYRVNAALNYNIQLWLKVGLAYEFENYQSNQVVDYGVNRVTLRISVGY